jgi:Flp pilus assembly protein TadG
MAVVMPMFATLAVGTFDMGRFAIEQNRLEQIARAGAQYVLQNISLAANTAGMEAAAEAAALVSAGPDTAGITVVAARVCSCASTGIEADCSGFCDDENVKAMELTVTVSHTLTPIFSFPNFIETRTLVADVTVQVQ